MTNGTVAADEPGDFERPRLTPEQLENMQRILSKMAFPTIKLPDSVISTNAETTRFLDARLDRFSGIDQQLISSNARFQAQMSTTINSDALKNLMAAQTGFTAYADRLIQNFDFSGIAAISAQFARQQAALLKNLVPAMGAMRAGFYPPNLHGIDRLDIASVNQIVMAEGIPLYGVPRTSIAEALVGAESESARRAILGRRWKTISADCRELLAGCTAPAVAQYVPVAFAALNALEAGHPMAAQALVGSLTDVVVSGYFSYFGKNRYDFTPGKKNPTNEAYEKFTIREFIAFAPIWQAYQQFFVSNGDKIPVTFSRNATVHTVSSRQYNRRNAVQGLMLVTSLLYRWHEEVAARP